MRVASVNVSQPRDVLWRDQTIRTSIFKEPVAGPVPVLAEHLAGDGQADLRVHGGPDKAIYAYPHEHYAYWQRYLPAERLVMGAFGENLTTTGLLETQVRVGDCYQVGTAILMAIQPRRPCFKLGIRLGQESIVQQFEQARRSGIYFRVVQPGTLQAGDAICLVQRSAHPVTIQHMVDQNAPGPKDVAKLHQLLQLPDLSASWRERFTRFLAQAQAE